MNPKPEPRINSAAKVSIGEGEPRSTVGVGGSGAWVESYESRALGLRVQGCGFRVLKVWGLKVEGCGIRVFRCRVEGYGFGVVGCRVEGYGLGALGCRVEGYG